MMQHTNVFAGQQSGIPVLCGRSRPNSAAKHTIVHRGPCRSMSTHHNCVAFVSHSHHTRHAQYTAVARSLRLQCTAQQAHLTAGNGDVSAILLAGGVGKRMGAAIPKQYLELRGQAIATYSLRTFASMPEIGEIVVVCEPEYREVFLAAHENMRAPSPPLVFALPGKERQDSVYNGLKAVRPEATLVAIHDSARPMMDADDVRKCISDALAVGAAVLGVPVKPTIKEVNPDGTVVATLQRSKLWEVQTPQVIRPGLLKEGFALVQSEGLEVTDDVSIIEAMGKPVRVTPGSYTNIKVTTPDDLLIAEKFLGEVEEAVPA